MITDQLSSIYNDYKSGKITNAQDASMQIDAVTARIRTFIQTQTPGANSEMIQNIIGPTLSLQQTYKDALTGKTTADALRSEEHTSELQSLMRISYAVFCLKKKKTTHHTSTYIYTITS